MASVEDYISANPELAQVDEVTITSSEPVRLNVEIYRISNSAIHFVNMGTKLSVEKDDVIEINDASEAASPTQYGKAAVLLLKPTASVRVEEPIHVTELAETLPFALSRPSAEHRAMTLSANELAWRENTGYQPVSILGGVSLCFTGGWKLDDLKGD